MFAQISSFIILVFALAAVKAVAQINSSTTSNAADASKATSRERGDDNDSPAGRNMLETREKWRLEAEEKEHRELLDRSEKAAHLSDELKKSFVQNNAFTGGDQTKLTELEKLIKKIRKNLGGGGSDENNDTDEIKPASLAEAFTQLSEAGASLNDELKKQTRHEISADSIDKSNEILDLIGLIRNFSQPK